MEHDEHDEQPMSAAPHVAAAAESHKRRAVAAGTAVGEDVGVVGGKPPAGDDGTWTTVTTRRARRRGCVIERMRIALSRSRGAAFYLFYFSLDYRRMA